MVIEVEGEHSEDNFWSSNDEYELRYEERFGRGQWSWERK